MAETAIRPELEQELAAVAESAGCELLAIERQGSTLRIVLDREDGGVTLADCERVSKQFSALLDVTDYGAGRYLLEVSSPGLDRRLYSPRDYRRFTGKLARVTFFAEDGGERRKRTVVGRLGFAPRGEDGGVVTLAEEGGRSHEIALEDVQQARLEIEL